MKGKTILVFIFASILFILFGYQYYNNKLDKTAEEALNTPAVKLADKETEVFSSDKIYITSSNGKVDVFVKGSNEDSNNYIGYTIDHLIKELDRDSASSNYDVWKLNSANEYTRTSEKFFQYKKPIVNPGEWDLAIRERGANDFVGGSIHGDEITLTAEFYVDGEEVSLIDEEVSQEAEEVKLVVTSELYRDNTITDNVERIAKRSKEYIFDKSGLIINQEVEFIESINLTTSHLAMLPIYRNRDGIQITDTVTTDYSDQEFDVSESGFDIPEIKEVKADKVKIYGKESGIITTVEVLERNNPHMQHSFTLSNSENYNKLYFSYVDKGHTTEIGEVWSQSVQYNIDTIN